MLIGNAGVVTAVATSGAAIVALCGVVAVIVQVHLDHKRRRGQATIETWMGTRDRRRELRLTATKSRETVFDAASRDDGVRTLNYWLGDLEFMALGVNTGMFDYETIDRMSGSYLIRTWVWVEPWVMHRREQRQSTLFAEFEELAEQLIKDRTDKNTMPRDLDIGMPPYQPVDEATSDRDGATSSVS